LVRQRSEMDSEIAVATEYRYKVWVEVEKVPLDGQGEASDYEDIGLPDPVGEYGSLAEAQGVVRQILGLHNPDALEDSDHK